MKHMKTLNDILSELQAVDQTSLDGVVAAIGTCVTDLQAFIAAQSAPAPVKAVSVSVTFDDGSVQTLPVTA